MKIFNKLRMDLLKRKRFTNYLLYAFGEIILVVLGILIALYINNSSKAEQIATSNINLQKRVMVQLEKDLEHLTAFRDELDTLNQVYLKALKRDYDNNFVKQGAIISTILFEVKDLGLDQQNVNWIDNAVLDNSEASEGLINLSSTYKLYFKNIEDLEQIIYKKMTTNLEHLEATQTWYTSLITDFKCGNDCITYLLYSDEYKAKIASLRFLYITNYGELVKGFYSELKRSNNELDRLMDRA